jgi:hypothetical protein
MEPLRATQDQCVRPTLHRFSYADLDPCGSMRVTTPRMNVSLGDWLSLEVDRPPLKFKLNPRVGR